MAGHSKWANIKHRKGAQDKKRGKIFTRIIKEITIAARDGGGEPDINPSLRLAIQNAKGANMPKDTIERAIKKGLGGDGANLQPVTYEGYAPNGIGVFVEATTDNLNRTVANVRAVFTKLGGNLGTNGSLSFIFSQQGEFTVDLSKLEGRDMDELEMDLIDGGAEDVVKTEELLVISTSFEDFGNMQKKLEDMGVEVKTAEVLRVPNNTLALGLEDSKKVLTFIEKMEDDDDVTTVYHNLELTDELLEVISEE
jgi:YebC/PmpR family DNA-binding regulatory protein